METTADLYFNLVVEHELIATDVQHPANRVPPSSARFSP
jgi:hypothetical protein